MKRRQFIQTSATTLALSALSNGRSHSASNPRKFALLVGINEYPVNDQGVSPLHGCVNDVNLIKHSLRYRYGFADQDIITLTNQQATREAILQAFQSHLIQKAQPGDIVVFSFSGHGSPLQDPHPIDSEDKTTGLVPYNCTLGEGNRCNYITGTTLFLLRSLFKTENVTIILDCCYADGGKRGIGRIKSITRRLGDDPFSPNQAELDYQETLMRSLNLNRAALNRNRETQQGAKGVILAAAQSYQTALDATFSNNYNAGAFTKFLTDTLWGKEQTFIEVQPTVIQSVCGLSPDPNACQKPVFTFSGDRLKTQPALFTAKQPASAQGVVLSVDQATRTAKLWLGAVSHWALGMQANSEFRCVSVTGKPMTIVRLTSAIAQDFTAMATIPTDQPLPKPGDLLQQYYRAVPTDFQLIVGIDSSVKAAIAFPESSRIVGKPLDDSMDVIFSQMTLGYHQDLSSLVEKGPIPAIGTYGLFSKDFTVIPMSFGSLGETVTQAVARLMPKLKAQLIQKLFRTMSATPQEMADAPDLKATVYALGVRSTKFQLSKPNQVIRPARVGEDLEIELTNDANQMRYVLLVSISPSSDVAFSQGSVGPRSAFKAATTIEATDVGMGEFLLIVSAKPLNEFAQQLESLQGDVLGSLQKERSRSVRSEFSNVVFSLPVLVERDR